MEFTGMSNQEDFLKPLLDLMNRRMDGVEKNLQENTKITNQILDQARYTNGRVSKAESDITALQKQAGRKFNFQPNLMYMIALGSVLLLVIIASLLNINIGGILK